MDARPTESKGQQPLVRDERRALRVWGLLLAVACALVVALNVGLARHARRMRDNDYRTYLAAATDLFQRDDLAGAIAQVQEALRKNPDAPEPHEMAGHVEYRLKHWDAAMAAYHRAIDKGSVDEGIRLNILWSLIELERHEEAAAFGEQCIAQGLKSPVFRRYIGEALFRAQAFSRAALFFEEALQGYPEDLYLLDHLQETYENIGETEKARAVAARIEDVQAVITLPKNGD